MPTNIPRVLQTVATTTVQVPVPFSSSMSGFYFLHERQETLSGWKTETSDENQLNTSIHCGNYAAHRKLNRGWKWREMKILYDWPSSEGWKLL